MFRLWVAENPEIVIYTAASVRNKQYNQKSQSERKRGYVVREMHMSWVDRNEAGGVTSGLKI